MAPRGDDDADPPSSLQALALSVPNPSLRPRPTLAMRAWFWGSIALTLGTLVFGVAGVVRIASLDVPLPHNVRLGFFGNGLPLRWTCPQGHDHWSLPYWMGTLVLVVVTGLMWRAWYVRRRNRRLTD